MEGSQPIYVYGVLAPSSEAPDTTGIGGGSLHTIVSDGLAALVSDLPGEELVLGREELTTHAHVLEEAIKSGTVLPMRFGVVMEDEPSVRERLLGTYHDQLQEQLEELQGKVELRLRAIYEEQPLMSEIVREDQDVARLREELKGAPEDATYYGRIRLGEMIAAAVERKREADTVQILDALEPLALATQLAEPSHERFVMGASFLVERDQVGEFDEAVDRIGRAQQHRMRLRYTGPLAPASFVELSTGEE
jgi:hypothetical protein